MASCVRWLPQQNPRLVHLKRRLLLVTLHIRLLHILRIDAYSSTRADCGAGSSTARTASGGAVPTAPSTMTLTPGQHFLHGAEVVTGGGIGGDLGDELAYHIPITLQRDHATAAARLRHQQRPGRRAAPQRTGCFDFSRRRAARAQDDPKEERQRCEADGDAVSRGLAID